MSTQENNVSTVFHVGEKHMQTQAGVRQELEFWGHKAIRPVFIEQHSEFFCQLPFMVLSARDSNGLPWATLLTGNNSPTSPMENDGVNAPFITSPDNTHLHFAANPIKGDALEHAFVEGAEVGLVGIELHSRRRNRANGVLSKVKDNSITFALTQAFGNCPQYISERILRTVKVDENKTKSTKHQKLTTSMQQWITNSDTLFIASGYQNKNSNGCATNQTESSNTDLSNGMDVSHRGGAAGFVKVVNKTQLVLPDYAGNNFFNTIGNLLLDPRVGLLFIDFETGSMLQLSATATIDNDPVNIKKYIGAHRLINIKIDAIVQLDNVLPLRWSLPNSIESGLMVTKKIKESDDVTSFEFTATQKDIKLPPFRAGQHLPIQLTVGENKQKIERTYSLSNSPHDTHYRISVKREPKGVASQYLHEHIQVGDVIKAKQPNGDFLVKFPARPVVLISAGIGVTPILSMLYSLVNMNIPSQVNVLYSVRNGDKAPLLSELRSLNQLHNKVSLAVAFSQPTEKDLIGQDYDSKGRINLEFIKQNITDLHSDFYICGPTGFLANTLTALDELGVKKERTHYESF